MIYFQTKMKFSVKNSASRLFFALQLEIKYCAWSIKKLKKCLMSSVKPNLTCSKVLSGGSFKGEKVLYSHKVLTNRCSNDSFLFAQKVLLNFVKRGICAYNSLKEARLRVMCFWISHTGVGSAKIVCQLHESLLNPATLSYTMIRSLDLKLHSYYTCI